MIHLVSCGYRYVHPDGIRIERPSGAGNYAFVFFKSKSEFSVKGKRMAADSDTYILFGPSTPHHYEASDLPFVNDWFHCEGDEMRALLTELNFPVNTLIKAADPSLISRSIMELHRIQQLGGPLRERIIDAEIRALMLQLRNLQELSIHTEKHVRYFREFSEIRDEFYNSPQNHPSVQALASRLRLSKSYFQHVYKEIFGCSVVTDMINGRLEYAKYLLKNSSLSVSEIAYKCGYEHDTHFMRQFKKFTGVTPSQFKS